jgi:hypothetical protein
MSRIAAVFAIVVLIFSPARGQPTEAELAGVFTKAADEVFARAKAKQSTDSADLLRDLIAQGVDSLLTDKKTSDREISAAAELVRRFAREMVKHGKRQADGTLLLTDASFSDAQKALCPLYPFC